MAEKINRRDEIVRVTSELFVKNGYNATSVREIAQEVGCTEAALYYHFKDGKRGLLKAVVETILPRLLSIIEQCRGSQSFAELITRYTDALLKVMPVQAQWFRWLVSDFQNFAEDERVFFYQNQKVVFHTLLEMIQPFIPDEDAAHRAAWTLICIGNGYMQMFYTLDIKSLPLAKPIRLIDLYADAFGLDLSGSTGE
jgi:AcrR family transcriptional regulator